MNKIVLALGLSFAALATNAQSLSPTVIASGGNYTAAGGYSLSYTVGEMAAITTVTSSNGATILTQGFQQPNDIINGLLDVEKEGDLSFSVYPNPTTDQLWFGYEFSQSGKVEVTLFNVVGQKLNYTLNESYDNGKVVHHFDCTSYAAGDYVMSVKFTSDKGASKTISKKFQIIN